MGDRHVMHSLGKYRSASARRTSSVRGRVDQSPGEAVRSSRRASKASFFISCQEIVRQFAELLPRVPDRSQMIEQQRN